MAAYSAGVSTVLLPEDNLRNLEEIDPIVRETLHFVPCRKASDVLSAALLKKESPLCRESVTDTEACYGDLIPVASTSPSVPLSLKK